MKKLIAIIISFILIFEGTIYGLSVPQGDFRRIASIEAKSLAEKEVMARVKRIKEIAGKVDITELERLRAIRDAAYAEVNRNRTKETKDRWAKAEEDYSDKLKEMQVKCLESLIDANQQVIEIFDIILKLDEGDAEKVINTMLEESVALREWAYKYLYLAGGERGWSIGICSIAMILCAENLNVEKVIKKARERLERYRWATGKLECPRPKFKSQKEKKEYIQRGHIAVRWMSHDSGKNIIMQVPFILDCARKASEPNIQNRDIESKPRGILDRFMLYTQGRDSKVFYEHEIYEYVYVLRMLGSFMESEIDRHIDVSRLNEEEVAGYTKARQKILDVVDDSLSFIEGDISNRQSAINLAEVVQEAFHAIISNDDIEEMKGQGIEISLELGNMEGVIFRGDRRKILYMFRVLFGNSYDIWLERNNEAKESLPEEERLQYRQMPLKINASFKLKQGEPMFEISVTDNAGGIAIKDKTLLDYSEEEPDMQVVFLESVTRRSKRYGATGLGLAEVRWHVKLHEGRVRFDNLVAENGEIKGVKITIELPSDRILSNMISGRPSTDL